MVEAHPIRTDSEYRDALARAERLAGVPLGADDPRAEELEALLNAIEAYEMARSATRPASSIASNGRSGT